MAAPNKPHTPRRNEEVWHHLTVAYRNTPGNHSQASQASGSTTAFCRNAWENGWPGTGFGDTPISTLIAREVNERHRLQVEAKLTLLDSEGEALRREREMRVKAREEEGKGSAAARQNALGLLGITGRVLRAGLKAAEVLEKRAAQLVEADSDEARMILRDTGAFAVRAQQVWRGALEAERIITGQPIAIVGVASTQLSKDDVFRALGGLARAMENATGDGITLAQAGMDAGDDIDSDDEQESGAEDSDGSAEAPI